MHDVMVLPPSKPPPSDGEAPAEAAASERDGEGPESGSSPVDPPSGPRLPPPMPPPRPSGVPPAARPPSFPPDPATRSSSPPARARLEPAPEALVTSAPLADFGAIEAFEGLPSASSPFEEEEEDDEPTVMSVRPRPVSGTALPAVVFVHSFGLDYRMWRPQIEKLSTRFRVLTIDLPGFGPQARAKGDVTPAFELARALDVCGLVRAHFVGAADGAKAVLDFALRHPRRVESLVLQGPVLPGHEVRGDAWERAISLAREGDKPTAIEMWLDSPIYDGARADDALFDEIRQIALDYGCGHWLDELRDCYLEKDPLPRLSELDLPALVVSGQHDAPELLALARDIAKALPRGEHKIVSGVGHLPNFEAPDSFNFLLGQFITEEAPASKRAGSVRPGPPKR